MTKEYKKTERPCVMCGRPVTGTAKKAYCSDVCRKRAARERAGQGFSPKLAERLKLERELAEARQRVRDLEDQLSKLRAWG